MPLDISKNDCIISCFQHVMRSKLTPRNISHTQGRAWDGFCYILGGSCRYRFSDGMQLTATAGNVLYLAKDSLYDMYIEEGPYSSIFVDFLFDSPLPRQSALFYPKDSGETEHRFLRLYRRFSVPSVGCQSDCLSLLYQIYASLQLLASPPYFPSVTRFHIERARASILEGFADQKLSIKELARRAEMSEVYFRKQFQSVYGTSPVTYLIDTRLSNAKRLMKYSDLSLEEIALQCGFSSLSYFCRVFKQQTELTPGQYRKRMD